MGSWDQKGILKRRLSGFDGTVSSVPARTKLHGIFWELTRKTHDTPLHNTVYITLLWLSCGYNFCTLKNMVC